MTVPTGTPPVQGLRHDLGMSLTSQEQSARSTPRDAPLPPVETSYLVVLSRHAVAVCSS